MKRNLQHIWGYWLGIGIISTALSATEERIEWKSVPYASEYHLQIQDYRGNRILDEKAPRNFYPIQGLAPGKYKIRVGVVSPFGTTIVWSKWRPLEIQESELTSLAKSLGKQEVEKNQASAEKVSHSPKEPGSSAGNFVAESSKIENTPLPVEASRNLSVLPPPSSERFPTLPGSFLNCNATQIPKEVIKECNRDYIVLDLSNLEKRSLYSIFVLESRNRKTRMQVVRFYRENCKMADTRIVSKFNDLHNSSDLSSEERTEIQKSLEAIQICR